MSEHDVTVSVLARSEQAARELMAELGPDRRVVAITASLGDGKYLIPEPWSESALASAISERDKQRASMVNFCMRCERPWSECMCCSCGGTCQEDRRKKHLRRPCLYPLVNGDRCLECDTCQEAR